MKKRIAIGIDIGGSHITSAAVDLDGLHIIPGTTHSNKVHNKGSKESIFKDWSKAINQTIMSTSFSGKINIGFAMPGPFHYKAGLAMFEGNDKYENLFNVSIPAELPEYIKGIDTSEFRFLNDATSFGVGVSALGKAKNHNKIIAITLGTGFGSSFIKDGIPKVNSGEVPEGGRLWDKAYKKGIADDYFLPVGALSDMKNFPLKRYRGVREIAEANNEHSKAVFKEFDANMADFILPFLQKYRPQIIVLGAIFRKQLIFSCQH